ncbi:MAG TPA: pilus assembly protein TadG-related protein [Actinomycetes bacterium]|nr:pilus assembly protein TadG-related protein [Actinomycetes bacterium]
MSGARGRAGGTPPGTGRPAPDRGQAGAVTAIVAVFFVALLAAAALVYDGGRAITAKRRAINQAEQAARAGARALDAAALRRGPDAPVPLDARAAAAQAQAYLDAIGAAGTVEVTGGTVRVTVAYREPTLLLGLVGIDQFSGSGTADAVSVRGVEEEDP